MGACFKPVMFLLVPVTVPLRPCANPEGSIDPVKLLAPDGGSSGGKYSTLCKRLVRWGADGWALFDTGVVSVSVGLLVSGNGNSWIKQLRLLRAFRLIRVLGKIGDIKQIVTAVAMSITPTLQALVSAHLFFPSHTSPQSHQASLPTPSVSARTQKHF
jgi:hypothetical protein